MLNKARLLLLAGVAILATVTGFCIGVPEENLTTLGIWAHGDTVLLFSTVHACKEDEETAHPPLQTLVSKDGGKTWAARGPRLLWSKLEFILDTGEEIWIAGDSYDAEGPANTPFFLLFDADKMEWPKFDIYDGYDELLTVAHDDHDGNRFLAWVNHLMLDPTDPDAAEDPGIDPTFLHESLDHGRTWHAVKKVKRVPKSAPGLHFFQEIPQQSGSWRIAGADQSSAALEQLGTDGKWQQSARLPLPVQERCEEQQPGNQPKGAQTSRPAPFSSWGKNLLSARAVEGISGRGIVLQRLPDGGGASADQGAANQAVMAVAAQPADTRSQPRVGADHRPVMKRPERAAVRGQKPGAYPAPADQRQLERRLFAGKNVTQSRSRGGAAQNGEDVFITMRVDAPQVTFVRLARLRGGG
jgi:hypothetical protein